MTLLAPPPAMVAPQVAVFESVTQAMSPSEPVGSDANVVGSRLNTSPVANLILFAAARENIMSDQSFGSSKT